MSEACIPISHIRDPFTAIGMLWVVGLDWATSFLSSPGKMSARHISQFSLRSQRLLPVKTQKWNYILPSGIRYLVTRISRTNSTIANKSTIRTNTKTDYGPLSNASKAKRSKETSLRGRMIRSCQGAQKRRPYLFQICTSLAIWFSADVIAQQVGDTEYDAAQTGRMLVIGGSASVPMYKW